MNDINMQPSRIRTAILGVGIALMITLGGWMWSRGTQSVATAAGPECKAEARASNVDVQISPKLQVYSFRFTSPTCTAAGQLEIYPNESYPRLPAQVIKEPFWAGGWETFFELRDINFDSYLDICFYIPIGSSFGTHRCWVFDRDSGLFAETPYSKEFGAIEAHDLRLYPAQRKIVTNHFFAACICGKSVYQMKGNHIVPVEKFDQEVVYDKDFHPLDQCRITHTMYIWRRPIVTTKTVSNFCTGYSTI